MSRRKSRPQFDPDSIDPHEIVQLGKLTRLIDGTTQAALIFPGIPEDMIEEVGRACSLAILAALKWPEDKAAILADRVQGDLRLWLARDLADLRNLKQPAARDLDDDMPF